MVDHETALLDENRQLTEVLDGADWSAPVPTCPEWSVLQLFRHVGRGDRWAAQIITDRRDTALDPRDVPEGRPPDDRDGALAWLGESPRRVLAAVSNAGPDTAVWTFLGPRPASWWTRRRLHEATVHRFDAANAVGADYALAPDRAADGISEHLDRLAATPGTTALDPDTTLSLQADDLPAGTAGAEAWLVTGVEGGLVWRPGTDPSGTTVSGGATDLFLAMIRRRSAEAAGLTITGDRAVWDRWLERTPF
jgi:uncharacterized protein (TIGR03083 family)